MKLLLLHHIQYAFLFILLQCLVHQTATSTEMYQQKCSGNECRRSSENLMLMKFIREQQRKKEQQLLENPEPYGDRQPFPHHTTLKTTTTTSTPKIRTAYRQKSAPGKRNSFINPQNNTTTTNTRRNSTKLAYNTTTDTGYAHNGTEPYAEQIVLYMVAQRRCNHHRRRCEIP